MKDVYDFLKKCGTYYLATVDGDQARVRPFGTIDLFDGKLYFLTGKVKDVSKQLHKDPKCEICTYDGQVCLRITCEAYSDDNVEAQKHMLDAYPDLQSFYTPGDGNTELFYLKNATAVFSNFPQVFSVVKF